MNVADAGRVKLVLELGGEMEGWTQSKKPIELRDMKNSQMTPYRLWPKGKWVDLNVVSSFKCENKTPTVEEVSILTISITQNDTTG